MVLIDELAGVTAYMSDPALRKQAGASLSRILTKGRALGVVVAAFFFIRIIGSETVRHILSRFLVSHLR